MLAQKIMYILVTRVLPDISIMPHKNPEKRKQYDKEYSQRSYVKEKKRAYYTKNKKNILARMKTNYDSESKQKYDKEYNSRPDVRKRKAEQRKRWSDANPLKVKAHNKARSHARRGVRMDSIAKEYVEMLLRDPCSYCGEEMEHIDHIIPLITTGDSSWNNLTAACQNCNYLKRDKTLLEALLRIN